MSTFVVRPLDANLGKLPHPISGDFLRLPGLDPVPDCGPDFTSQSPKPGMLGPGLWNWDIWGRDLFALFAATW